MDIIKTHCPNEVIRLSTPGGINIGDCIRTRDGYYLFEFMSNEFTHLFKANDLRQVSDIIDELNAPWENKIKEYFKNKNTL
jgi:hypothetical protein